MLRHRVRRFALLALIGTLLVTPPPSSASEAVPPPGYEKIQHILVIYLENHSFDNLFGLFPGADGLQDGSRWAPQVDANGAPYATLPPVVDSKGKTIERDTRFPESLPNAPFLIDRYVGQDAKTPDPLHRFYQNQAEIDGGRNDKFVLLSGAGALPMGYYDGAKTKIWDYARRFTLADHFFMSAFGGTFLNHMTLICACTPVWDQAPAKYVAQLDSEGHLVKDGVVSPDGYAINNMESVYPPHSAKFNAETPMLPAQTMPTIGDRLSAKNVSWAWYTGGWNEAAAGHPPADYGVRYCPFAFFAAYGPGTPGRAQHLKGQEDLYQAIDDGTLPQVAFFKPLGHETQHPNAANITDGDLRVADVIDHVEKSSVWGSTVIIVTYDENGGFWDHVAPPAGDRWGPGTRIPAVIISPFARLGEVDHTTYETLSILKFIETRFGLEPLNERDTRAANLAAALRLP